MIKKKNSDCLKKRKKKRNKYNKIKKNSIIKQALMDDDVNSFIESINFEDVVYINLMGDIVVEDYVHSNPQKYSFSAHLALNST
ncbi:hypothetical protein [Bacillus sp. VT 712]|uniref:hypothetical protein n=1 Tax=Bacillus sp. VT 712 TaxID=1848047 RepID=UPI0012E7A7F1|nr:hypothetical protein [Bacillus sp. VT 712]